MTVIYVSYYQWLGSFSFKLAWSVQQLKVYFFLCGLWSILYFSSQKFVCLEFQFSLKQHIYERKSFLFITPDYMVSCSNSAQLFQFYRQVQLCLTKTKLGEHKQGHTGGVWCAATALEEAHHSLIGRENFGTLTTVP